MNKIILAVVIASTFSGCAEISSFVSGVTTAGNANEKVANSNIIAADKLKAQTAADQFCTMTVATLQQNPQWVKSVESLCWSGVNTTVSQAADASILVPTVPVATPKAQ